MIFMETNNEDPKWILEPPLNCLEQESEIDHLYFLYQKGKFYVMDNHLAAGWCWLHTLDKQKKYGLIHIDQHNDCINNKNLTSCRDILLKDSLTLSEYTSLSIDGEKVFTWDNYIFHTHQLFPEWFKDARFSTHRVPQEVEIEISFNPSAIDLLSKIKSTETNIDYILNLDIDFFFNDNGERIASDDEICQLAKEIKRLLPNIAVVTIALSPECCERDSDGWKNAIEAMSILDNELSIGFVEEFKSKIQL